MSKKLQYLIIHCTATPEGRHVSVADIEQWHLKERGWSRVGYSDMITLDGSLMNLHPFDTNDVVDPWEITNGVRGFNGLARHIVYAGGTDRAGKTKDTRTALQKATMTDYVRYMVKRHPDIQVAGHNQFSDKECPSFDVPKWLCSIMISEQNIYKQ